MKKYTEMDREELLSEKKRLEKEYAGCRGLGLKLDMSRGKPSPEQIDLVDGLLNTLNTNRDCYTDNKTDARNYGMLEGIPEARALFGELMGVSPHKVLVGGNSSLNMMYDTIARFMLFGTAGEQPWSKLGEVKFLCPVPGYDRHFAVTEAFGIKMINIKMDDNGPDMDEVRKYAENDPAVKGIWCCPVYSNPEGIVYSDGTVRALAALKPAARDFKIFWDNAYIVHSFDGHPAEIPNIIDECEKAGRPDMAIMFISTSKISYPGSGVAAMASGAMMIEEIKKQLFVQTIGPNKLNQLAHVRYFRNRAGVLEHMAGLARLLKPKFDLVLDALDKELGYTGTACWKTPRGGYFISVDLLPGTAKRVVELAKNAGVVLTGAGATFPYRTDPEDKNLRIAPSYPPLDELRLAMEIFTVAARLAAVEKLLQQ